MTVNTMSPETSVELVSEQNYENGNDTLRLSVADGQSTSVPLLSDEECGRNSNTTKQPDEESEMSFPTENPNSVRWSVDLRLVPCQVCGASSSGYHFGVISCEGCKGFFRRTITHGLESTYTCYSVQSTGTRCHIQALGRKCKKCRFILCQEMGMTTEGGKTGRHSYLRRIQTHRHVEQLRAENRLLSAPLLRFRRRTKKKPNADEGQTSATNKETPKLQHVARQPPMQAGQQTTDKEATQLTPWHFLMAGRQQLLPAKLASNHTSQEGNSAINIAPPPLPLLGAFSSQHIGGKKVEQINVPELVEVVSDDDDGSPAYAEKLGASSSTGFHNVSGSVDQTSTAAIFSDLLKKYESINKVSEADMLTASAPLPTISNLNWIYDSARARFNLTSQALTAELQSSTQTSGDDSMLMMAASPYNWPSSLLQQNGMPSSFVVNARADWLVSQVIQSSILLRKVSEDGYNVVKPDMTLDRFWSAVMRHFEDSSKQLLAFVRSLFGFNHLHFADRTNLFVESAFPLFFAQMSIEQSPTDELVTNELSREITLKYLRFDPNSKSAIRVARLKVAEFDNQGLVEPSRLTALVSEYRQAMENYVSKRFLTKKQSDDHLNELEGHIKHFRQSKNLYLWLIRNFPSVTSPQAAAPVSEANADFGLSAFIDKIQQNAKISNPTAAVGPSVFNLFSGLSQGFGTV